MCFLRFTSINKGHNPISLTIAHNLERGDLYTSRYFIYFFHVADDVVRVK